MNWFAFITAFAFVCVGYTLGVFFHANRIDDEDEYEDDEFDCDEIPAEVDATQARELLSRFEDITTAVDNDVDRHASRVSEISGQLSSGDQVDSAAVLAAASQLLEANKQLQADLATAKQEIQNQQGQLQDYMVEARMDTLTNVGNRRAFDEEIRRRVGQWERRGTPVSLALVDIDHFKSFNDTHGHQVGDGVLRGVARVLKKTVRAMDVVARYGGEEFGIILPATTINQAMPAVTALCQAVSSSTFRVEDESLRITVSIGLAQAVSEEDVEGLVKRADDSLYAAKEAGRNCSFYHDGEKCEMIKPSKRSKRRSFKRLQRIAACVDDRFPEEVMFREIECEDVSPTGFSYLLPEVPEGDRVVMSLGGGANLTYMTATVKSSSNLGTDSNPMFRIVCEFTARCDLPDDLESDDGDADTAVAEDSNLEATASSVT